LWLKITYHNDIKLYNLRLASFHWISNFIGYSVVSLWQKKANKIKIGLNLLLWLSVCMLVVNPSWTQSADTSKIFGL